MLSIRSLHFSLTSLRSTFIVAVSSSSSAASPYSSRCSRVSYITPRTHLEIVTAMRGHPARRSVNQVVVVAAAACADRSFLRYALR
jgi:hypothetical protein